MSNTSASLPNPRRVATARSALSAAMWARSENTGSDEAVIDLLADLRHFCAARHIDFAAFDNYFLGRPKLDAIRVQFIPDKNTMVANLNAKAIQVMMTLGGIPEFEAMLGVKRDWEATLIQAFMNVTHMMLCPHSMIATYWPRSTLFTPRNGRRKVVSV